MKIRSTYVLRSVADHHIVVPIGQEAVNFNGIMTLNKSGKLLFESMKLGADIKDLVSLLVETYEVDEIEALKDVKEFIKILESKHVFE